MKVLVIGGTGFFGKELVYRLLDDGCNVTILTRGTAGDEFGNKVNKFMSDRHNFSFLRQLLTGYEWDIVYDQLCFDYETAVETCDILKGKIGRYICTSTASVYNNGFELTEDKFEPCNYKKFKEVKRFTKNYAEAKRQMEAGVCKVATFPFTLVRFPIVLGAEDNSGRFGFQIDQIANGENIHLENPDARISFINSTSAGDILFKLSKMEINGPVNVASPTPMCLKEVLDTFGTAIGKKAKLTEDINGRELSPYSIKLDWSLNTDLIKEKGIKIPEISSWLPDEVNSYLVKRSKNGLYK